MAHHQRQEHDELRRRERRLSVRNVRRDPVDGRKLARALLSIVAAEAAAEHSANEAEEDRTPEGRS